MNSNTLKNVASQFVHIPAFANIRAFTCDLTNEMHVSLVVGKINKTLALHENAYTLANDGSKSEKYISKQEDNMAAMEIEVETVARALGAKTYWPGLYPAFKYNDKHFYTMEALLKFRAEEAKNVH